MSRSPSNHLLIGGAGAVGRRLLRSLTSRGDRVVCADFSQIELPHNLLFRRSATLRKSRVLKQYRGIDVRDQQGLINLMKNLKVSKSNHNDDTGWHEPETSSHTGSQYEYDGFENPESQNVTVWNLAAPLSVETAKNPEMAKQITVGGMQNVLSAMAQVNAENTKFGNTSNTSDSDSKSLSDSSEKLFFTKLMFTDSIGSFGSESPRKLATARWLIENPNQDPGSDYGLQKRACREIMKQYWEKEKIDTRFAVLPGVLHAEALWGAGTTEYALDAVKWAVKHCDPDVINARGVLISDGNASDSTATTSETSDSSESDNSLSKFRCPIDPDVILPMVYSEDLIAGLISLEQAPIEQLLEPDRGYCLPGLSFSARQLFDIIQKEYYPNFDWEISEELGLDPNMDKFSRIWPDTLSTVEPERDLGYRPKIDSVKEIVGILISGHRERMLGIK